MHFTRSNIFYVSKIVVLFYINIGFTSLRYNIQNIGEQKNVTRLHCEM